MNRWISCCGVVITSMTNRSVMRAWRQLRRSWKRKATFCLAFAARPLKIPLNGLLNRRLRSGALPLFLVKIPQAQLGDADVVGFE